MKAQRKGERIEYKLKGALAKQKNGAKTIGIRARHDVLHTSYKTYFETAENHFYSKYYCSKKEMKLN